MVENQPQLYSIAKYLKMPLPTTAGWIIVHDPPHPSVIEAPGAPSFTSLDLYKNNCPRGFADSARLHEGFLTVRRFLERLNGVVWSVSDFKPLETGNLCFDVIFDPISTGRGNRETPDPRQK